MSKGGRVGRGTHRGILRKRQKFTCYWCLRDLPPSCETIDHIMPLCRGGSNKLENKCLACAWCNQSKGDMLPSVFLQWVRSLPKGCLGKVRPNQVPAGFRPSDMSAFDRIPGMVKQECRHQWTACQHAFADAILQLEKDK